MLTFLHHFVDLRRIVEAFVTQHGIEMLKQLIVLFISSSRTENVLRCTDENISRNIHQELQNLFDDFLGITIVLFPHVVYWVKS